MNILAKEQLKMLEKGISEKERTLRTEKFNEPYFKLRHKNENSLFGKLSLKSRQRLHKFVLLVYTIKNHLGGFSYETIKDKRETTDRPVIFAVTNVGKFDIEVVSEAIKDHYYLLSGDFKHLQGTIDASFLELNGAIYFNEYIKEDRADASRRMIEHLKSGGNLMYFPEGTWNLSPNLPMLPCYWGIVQIAQKSNAIIVPVATEQYEKRFKINIGSNFDMQKFGSEPEEKLKAINALRDVLATLKWEIWETEPLTKRCDIFGDEWDNYISDRFKEWPYFNLEYIDGLIFKPKNVVEYRVAFGHLNNVSVNACNAFLFNKRLN